MLRRHSCPWGHVDKEVEREQHKRYKPTLYLVKCEEDPRFVAEVVVKGPGNINDIYLTWTFEGQDYEYCIASGQQREGLVINEAVLVGDKIKVSYQVSGHCLVEERTFCFPRSSLRNSSYVAQKESDS